ncbi:MAG: hypothetical protein HQK79_19580 [Desulfobacterales bacterium]|nr:hypothetical protein [Desulfobacterales bacterium]
MLSKINLYSFFIIIILGFAISTNVIDIAIADEHHERHSSKISDDDDDDRHSGKKRIKSAYKNIFHGKGDHGNEVTGQISGWLFAIANLTVVLSLLSKVTNIKQINQIQKKYLKHIHYIFNILALCFVFIHFILSSCKSTFLPECGMLIMAFLIGSGVIIKFKILPATLQKWIYKLHTSFVPSIILVSIIILGHSMVD